MTQNGNIFIHSMAEHRADQETSDEREPELMNRDNALLRKTAQWFYPFTVPVIACIGLLGYALVMGIAQSGWQTGGQANDAVLLLSAQTLLPWYDPVTAPLAVWITWAVESGLGPGLLSVRLAGMLLLLGTYGALYATSCLLTEDRRFAVLGTLAPAATVHMGWYPFLALEQIVPLAFGAAMVMWGLTALMRQGSWLRHGLFGLGLAIGLLADPVLTAAMLAIPLALLCTETGRQRLLCLPMLYSLVFAIAIAGPFYGYGLWVMPDGLTPIANLTIPTLATLGAAWGQAGVQALSVLLPAAIVPLLFITAFSSRRRPPDESQTQLLQDRTQPDGHLTGLIWPMIMAVAVFVYGSLFGFSGISEETFVFLIVLFAPLYAWISQRGPWRQRPALAMILPVFACAVMPLALLQFLSERRANCHSKCAAVYDYAGLAEDLRSVGFSGTGEIVVLTDRYDLPLVNLRPYLPDATLITPLDPQLGHLLPDRRAAADGQCLFLWSEYREPEWRTHLWDEGLPQIHLPPVPTDAATGSIIRPLAGGQRSGPAVGWMMTPAAHGPCTHGRF